MHHIMFSAFATVRLTAFVTALAVTALLAFGPTHSAEASHAPTGVDVVAGANLVTYDGPTLPVTQALNNIDTITVAVWRFDAASQQWQAWTASLPESLRGFAALEHGRAYFLITNAAAAWQFPEAPLPSQPPAIRLFAGDQTHEATLASYCWPVEPGVGICADSAPLTFDTFFAVPNDRISLEIDAPTPDTLTLSLQTPDGLAVVDGDTTRIDVPGDTVTWTPSAAPGDYILAVFATWVALGGQGGDAAYFIPITLEGVNAPFPTQLQLAPIESAEIVIAESFPPQYFVQIVSALPNGCVQFERLDLTRDGTMIQIDIWNRVPAPEAEVACTLIFGLKNHNVALGSDFESGVEYTVQINDLTRTFIAQ